MQNTNSIPPIKNITQIPTLNFHTSKLDNNIEIYFLEDKTLDITNINFVIDKGVWHQKNPLVASFTNRMLLEGSQKYNSEYINLKIDLFGANIRKHTHLHSSIYHISVLEKYSEELIEIFFDCFTNPLFPEKEFEINRQILKQRYAIELEKIDFLAEKFFKELIFGKNNFYGKFAELSDYDNLQLSWIQEYWKSFYKIENLKIIFLSKNPEKTLKILNNTFGKIPSGAKEPETVLFKCNTKPDFLKIKKPGTIQAALRIGWLVDNVNDEELYKVKILVELLGGFFGSKLMQNIREKLGYTYSIYAFTSEHKYANSIQIVSELSQKYIERTIEEIKNEIIGLKTTPITAEELSRLKNYIMGELYRLIDGNLRKEKTLTQLISHEKSLDYLQKYAHTILNITAEEIKVLAEKYLNEQEFYGVLIY